MKKRLSRAALAALILVLCYAAAAIVPYAVPVQVDPAFQDAFSRGDFYGDGTLSGPDRAGYVPIPQDAFALRLSLIETARHELIFSSYSTEAGETSDLFWGALLCAADRGVSVRIILDGMFGGLGRGGTAQALAAHPNIELVYFNPINLLRPYTLNSRLHDKYLIADRQVMLLGGRNLSDAYFDPDGYDGPVSHDNDVLVWNTGGGDSVIGDVAAYFESACAHELSEPAFGDPGRQAGSARVQADGLREKYRSYGAAQPLSEQQLTDLTVPTDKITLISNPFTGLPKQPLILWQLLQLAETAQSEVRIQSPYTVISSDIREQLAGLATEKRVVLLTNSLASSPNPPAFSAYLWNRAELAASGLLIYEYQSSDSIHGKSVLIDDRLSAVGSWNLDERSIDIDTEVMLVIDSAPFQQLLRARQGEILAQSLPVGPDGEYLPGSVGPLPVPAGKKALFYGLSILSHLFGFLI